MIFYFTGTGNSLYAADRIAREQGEQLVSIAQAFTGDPAQFEYTLKENELLGFIYPVYAWAPPKIVLDFIARLKVSGGKPYVFSLATCGDEEGKTKAVLQKALARRGLQLDSAFSLIMPNNYVVGFDVDPKELELKKLRNAEQRLLEINAVLSAREKNMQLLQGRLSGLKTYLINPLFNKFGRNTRYFTVTDACTSCRLCERICPVHTITVTQKPVWGKSCTQCLGCLNRCPVKAIQYTKGTIKKGRYIHPEMNRLQK